MVENPQDDMDRFCGALQPFRMSEPAVVLLLAGVALSCLTALSLIAFSSNNHRHDSVIAVESPGWVRFDRFSAHGLRVHRLIES